MHAERPPRSRTTEHPQDTAAGASSTLDGVWPRVYDELRRLAHRRLSSERTGHTLSTTALVHEVYLRLQSQRAVECENRALFFTQAARAMRRILVDYARRHRAQRRGGAQSRVPIEALNADDSAAGFQIAAAERAEELLALDEALERLTAIDSRLAKVIEYRFFAGLTEEEVAAVLGVTARTVARDWVKARAWLRQQLEEPGAHEH